MNANACWVVAALLSSAACSVSKEKVKAMLEEDPELVLRALEKRPEKFAKLVAAAQASTPQSTPQAAPAPRGRVQPVAAAPQAETPAIPASMVEGRALRGAPTAPVTITAYSDFECPFCAEAAETIEKALVKYGDKVRYVHKHNPLPGHPKAKPAALTFEAIALQSPEKAYRFHDKVFAYLRSADADDDDDDKDKDDADDDDDDDDRPRKRRSAKPRPVIPADPIAAAVAELGLDEKKLREDIGSAQVSAILKKDRAEAKKLGFNATPSFVINGKKIVGAPDPDDLADIIDAALKIRKKKKE
jgi:protein-disulfide isomerase